MNNITPKQFFKNYGIFIFLTIIAISILVPITFASNRAWQNGLKVTVDKVLNEEAVTWDIGDSIEINNPMINSCAAYNVQNFKTKEKAIAVVLRNTTFFGPLVGIFIYYSNDDIQFKGYSTLHGRIAKQVYDKPQNKRVEYWQKKIPSILDK